MLVILSGTDQVMSPDGSLGNFSSAAGDAAAHATTTIVKTTSEVGDLVSSFDWANPTWDLFIVLFFVVGAFLYGMSLGRDRIIVILLSVYMSLAVINSAPFLKNGSSSFGSEYSAQLTVFIGVFVFLFFLLSRLGLMRTLGRVMSGGNWLQVLIFSTLHAGLMVSIILSLMPPYALSHFSDVTVRIFTTDTAQFAWIIAPIIAMSLVRKEEK